MRKVFKSFMLVAAAAMAFVSCQKQEISAPETISATLTMHAGVHQTKTYIAENTVLWGTGESVKLYIGAGEGGDATTTFVNSDPTDDFDGQGIAEFTFEINDVEADGPFVLGGVYPVSITTGINNNTNPKAYKVQLPATQQSVDGQYDPSAYIMVLKPELVNELPTEYQAWFRRATALNKITLSNVAEDITAVEIIVPEKKYLAGRRNFDLTTGESGEIYDSGTQTNTVKVTGDFKAGSFDVWFCSWGVELEGGETMTIKMTSANNIYTRSIIAREKGIKFIEGDLNKLAVDMASAEVEALSNITGEYLIASKTASGWFLMTSTNAGKYYSATASVSSATEVTCADFYGVADVENYVWDVAKYENGYSIQNMSTSNYVVYSGSSNEAYADEALDEKAMMDIKLDGQSAIIESMNVAGRKLQYNASSPRFAFYTTVQAAVYMIPWTPDTTPRIIAETKEFNVSAAETTVEIPYTVKNITGEITAVVAENATMSIVSTNVAADKVTVTFDANTESTEKTATIVLSYEGAQSQEVVITQAAAGQTKQYYVKVTETPSDWSGTYLIVFDDNKAHATVSGKDLNATSGALTINEGKIEATSDLNATAAVTISKNGAGYSILLPNGTYLKVSSSNPISNATPVANYISFVANTTQKGSIRISGDANFNTSSYILYHQTSYFRCYTNKLSTSNYYLPDLYRLEEEGETPEPDPTPDPEPVQLAMSDITCSAQTENSLTFTWEKVDNATSYEVTCNDETKTVTTTQYVAINLAASTSYTISVVAKGNGTDYLDSEPKTQTGTTKEKQQSGGSELVETFDLRYTATDVKNADWSITQNEVSLHWSKGSASNIPSPNKEGSVRMYTGTTLTINAPENKKITRVVFTPFSTSYNATKLQYNSASLTSDDWQLTTPANQIVLTATANARFKEIKVYYN